MPVEVIQNEEAIAILQPQVAALQTGLTGVQGDVSTIFTGMSATKNSISTLNTKINNWSNIAPVSDIHFGLNELYGHETYGLIMGTHLAMHYKDILDCGTIHTSNITSALGNSVTFNSNVTLHDNALTCGTINSSTITSMQDQITALPTNLSTWAANVASEDVKLGAHKLDFGSGTVTLKAEGDQLTTLGSFYAQKSITTNDYIQSNGDAYLGVNLFEGSKATVFVDKINKLLSSDFDDVSLTKFKDITISGTLSADTLKFGSDVSLTLSKGNTLKLANAAGPIGFVTGEGSFTGLYSSGDFQTTGPEATLCSGALKIQNNVISTVTDASLSGFNEISCSKLKYDTLEPAIPLAVDYVQTLFVDAGGKDTNTGSAAFPFATIAKAVEVATAAYVAKGHICNIIVAHGSYAENIVITKPMQLTGSCSSRYAKDCKITGDILVQLEGTVDMHASKVTITGFLVNGKIIDTSSSTHCLLIKDAYLYAPDHCIYQNTQTNIDSRTYIENVTIDGSSALSVVALVEISSGVLLMTQCGLSSKALQNVLTVSGTAEVWNCSLCTFENSHNSASVPAIVHLSTSKYQKFKVFAYCSFSYTSPTAKVNGVNQNTGIYVDGQGSSLVLLSSNTFSLSGVASGNVVHSGPGGCVVFYANNYSMSTNAGPQASGITGVLNQSKFACTPVS